jgi:replicative DNA helicase
MNEEIIKRIEQTTGTDEAPEHVVWERLRRLCDKELQRFVSEETAFSLKELYTKAVTNKKQKEKYIPTGYTKLDALTGGVREGELVVIGGRPSSGKSQLLINLSINMSQYLNVLYMSFDLSQLHLLNRFMASLADVEYVKFRTGALTKEDAQAVKKASKTFENYKLWLDNKSFLSYDLLELYLERQIEAKGVKVLMIDYLQNLVFNNTRRYNRDAELDEICRRLRRMAARKGVCIIAASEMNRAAETHRSEGAFPSVSALRDSGGIEQHADKILLIVNRYSYSDVNSDGTDVSNTIDVHVAKNTDGPIGRFRLKHNNKFTCILNEDELPDYAFDKRIKELGLKASNIKSVFDSDEPVPY